MEGSGSRLAQTLNNLTVVPRMKKYNTIAFKEGHEWDTAFGEFLNQVGRKLSAKRLTDKRIHAKSIEFNRMNNVLKIFMIDTTSKKLASVSTQDVLTALFSRYKLLQGQFGLMVGMPTQLLMLPVEQSTYVCLQWSKQMEVLQEVAGLLSL